MENETALSPEEESAFREWVKQNKVNFNPDDLHQDYDMRGFWKAQQEGDPVATSAVNSVDGKLHYSDVWKKPNHPTFSVESKYADNSAGKWEGEGDNATFIPPGITLDNSPSLLRGELADASNPKDIADNQKAPIDLNQLKSDKVYQDKEDEISDPDVDIHHMDI